MQILPPVSLSLEIWLCVRPFHYNKHQPWAHSHVLGAIGAPLVPTPATSLAAIK